MLSCGQLFKPKGEVNSKHDECKLHFYEFILNRFVIQNIWFSG